MSGNAVHSPSGADLPATKSFREIEWKSPTLMCPACETCSISVFLRCDGGDRECLMVAACTICGRQFDAAVLPTYQERYDDLSRKAQGRACPACSGGPTTVRSLCDRVARECFFVLACASCGDVRLADGSPGAGPGDRCDAPGRRPA